MKTRLAIAILLVLCMLPGYGVSASVSSIPNPSFETDSGWAFSSTDDDWNHSYATDWFTDGARSLKIYIPGDPDVGYYPGENTYAQVSQAVDLTGAVDLRFDLKTNGIWDIPGPDPNYYNSIEVLVDDTVVYSKERQIGTFLNQAAPIAGFDGSHTLTIRMRNHADFASNFERSLFVDNLKLVTSKVFAPLITKPVTCSGVPTLVAPGNGSQLNTIMPEFKFNDGKFPGVTNLRVTVSPSSLFEYTIGSLWTSGQSGLHTWRFPHNFNPSTKYYWRAYVMCGDVVGPYTETWSFTTGAGGTILPAPALLSPANGSTLAGTTTTLQWSPVNGAVEYYVFWGQAGSYSHSFTWTANPQILIDYLSTMTTYEWYVYARNDYGLGNQSAKWQFSPDNGSNLTSDTHQPIYIENADGSISIMDVAR